jgi:hypothetical protein
MPVFLNIDVKTLTYRVTFLCPAINFGFMQAENALHHFWSTQSNWRFDKNVFQIFLYNIDCQPQPLIISNDPEYNCWHFTWDTYIKNCTSCNHYTIWHHSWHEVTLSFLIALWGRFLVHVLAYRGAFGLFMATVIKFMSFFKIYLFADTCTVYKPNSHLVKAQRNFSKIEFWSPRAGPE